MRETEGVYDGSYTVNDEESMMKGGRLPTRGKQPLTHGAFLLPLFLLTKGLTEADQPPLHDV